MTKPAKFPFVLMKERKTVKDMKPGEEGFISRGAIVVDPETEETWVWAGAEIREGEPLTLKTVHVSMGNDEVSLQIPSTAGIEPRYFDEKQDYIPVKDIKVV